jgi:uncharacterized membrane protein YdbT with pleckstrin-like domain
MEESESVVWEGTPSQLTNLGHFILSLTVIWLPVALAKWLQVKCHKYTVTTGSIKERRGVFSRTTEEIELFRVKDISFVEPFHQRLVGLGTLVLHTSDKTQPTFELKAIADAEDLRDKLRKIVAAARQKRGVREVDFE